MAAPIEASADIASAANAGAQSDADKITSVFRRPKMFFSNRQRVGIVLNRDGQAENVPQVRTRIGARPAGKVPGGIDNLTGRRVHPACRGQADGLRLKPPSIG